MHCEAPPEAAAGSVPFEMYAAACDFVREFNEYVEPDRVFSAASAPSEAKGDRPGDDFNRRASWAEVLEPHGWKVCRTSGPVTYWTRPGKDPRHGCSATTGRCTSDLGGDLLYVFTSNALPFDAEAAYDKFGALTRLECRGDFAASTQAVVARGYGTSDPADVGQVIFGKAAAEGPPDDGVKPDFDFATNVDLKRLDLGTRWAWERWFQLGTVNLLAAEGGLGKTRFVADLCRRIHAGGEWPDGTPVIDWPGEYLAMWVAGDRNQGELLTLSESFGFGARICYSGSKAEPLSGVTLNTPSDFATLYRRVKAARPLFLVIDTAGGATGMNLAKQEEARTFFAPLSDIAARLQLCVIVITHLNASKKVLGKRAEERVRVVVRMTAANKEPATPRRLEVVKSNSLYPKPLGMVLGETGNDYSDTPPPPPEDEQGGTAAPRDDSPDRGPPTKVRECMDWLEDLLAERPERVGRIRELSDAKGYSAGLLYKAKNALDLIETGTKGQLLWALRK